MPRYIALLRAVNVGGAGKLAMSDLRAICRETGFRRVETYIASGNVVFETDVDPATAKRDLEAGLRDFAGKPLPVVLRTADELHDVLDGNPFPNAPANFTFAIFLDAAPPVDALAQAVGRADEEVRLGAREVYIHYPAGMGRSKLKIPAAKHGTARNMNTIAKLVEMARGS